jgi:Flp pilus assembly protein TadD
VQALEHYTKAIELDSTMAAAFSNRALALIKLGRPAEAEADCTHALLLQPGNVKALLRRAAARFAGHC